MKLKNIITEINVGNVSNVIGRIILKQIKKHNKNFTIRNIHKDLQGKFKSIFFDMTIDIDQTHNNTSPVDGYMTKTGNLVLFIRKKLADEVRSGDDISIDMFRRELITVLEHELTHVIQRYKYPKSMKHDINMDGKFSDKFFRKYAKDYREVEAHANQLIKLAKDYRLDISKALEYYADRFNIDKKLLYKKLWKLGAFTRKFHSKYPLKKPSGGSS